MKIPNTINIKDILLLLFVSSLIIYTFFYAVEYQQVVFNSDKTELLNQFRGNYGQLGHFRLHELYPHMYAGMLLFIASIISVKVLYFRFGKSRFTWRPVIAGIFITGLIGLGETLEHLFDVLGHEFFHYVHLLAGLLAMFFLYMGTQEYRMQYKKGGKPINRRSIIGLIVILPLLAFTIALNSSKAWDTRVELPFVYLTVAPTVVLAGMTLLESYKQKEENKILMGFLAILAGTVTGLTVIILLGRIGDIGNYAFLYVLGQSLQAIALSATAMLILVFTFTMWAIADSS